MQFDLNDFLDNFLFGEAADKRDYKKFPECRPWPILFYEMAKVEDKYLKRLPKYIQTSMLNALKPIASKQNLWQRFNSYMGCELTEEYIWFRMFQYQRKHGSLISDAIIQEIFDHADEINIKEKDFGKETTHSN